MQGRTHAETILKADKDVFNLHAINLTAIGTALPSKYLFVFTLAIPNKAPHQNPRDRNYGAMTAPFTTNNSFEGQFHWYITTQITQLWSHPSNNDRFLLDRRLESNQVQVQVQEIQVQFKLIPKHNF